MNSPLYRDLLLAHSRAPHGAATIPPGGENASAVNSACGDTTRWQLRWHDGRLAAATHDTRGCALCVAAASMLADVLPGRSADELRAILDDALARLPRGDFPPDSPFAAFNGLPAYPARVACAALPFRAVRDALPAPPP